MFKKVLISDDLESINQGIHSVLESLKIKDIEQTQYCDDAYLKIKKGFHENNPFDLLITDLSFKSDHREEKITSGEVLTEKLKKEHPDLKIIVYSVEDRIQIVRSLMLSKNLDAYVCKGRNGLLELRTAVETLFKDQKYLSPQVAHAINDKIHIEIDDYEIEILKLLSKGFSQDEISRLFRKNNTSPSSLSSIEKKLNKLRIQFKANNAIHLVSIVKDLGLI
tara:strand:- start:9498 stop:10163 length:666 start_codon:yes stop_codon:yes gene_type:complete